MDKTENGDKDEKRVCREKGSWDLSSVSALMSTAGGCRAQNKNFPIERVEDDGNLGKAEDDGTRGKVAGDDNPGKVEEDGSLVKDKLQVYKTEMMEKQ